MFLKREGLLGDINSFGAKFQTTFVICFLILTNYRLERRLYVKKDWMSNNLDPDETAHWAVSSGSMLFAKAIIIVCGMKELKYFNDFHPLAQAQHHIYILFYSCSFRHCSTYSRTSMAEPLWDLENLFETAVVRASEGYY